AHGRARGPKEQNAQSPTSQSPAPSSGCSRHTLDCSCVYSGKASSSMTRPVNASKSPSSLGTGKPHPSLHPLGWPNAFCSSGRSRVIVLEASTRQARSPCQRPAPTRPTPAPARDASASRIADELSRSSCWSTASGRRILARQYAPALSACPARCRRWVIAVLNDRTWSTNRWTVATGPSLRSRHSCPAPRQASVTDASGRKRRRSCLIRSRVRETLAIRGLLLVRGFSTYHSDRRPHLAQL